MLRVLAGAFAAVLLATPVASQRTAPAATSTVVDASALLDDLRTLSSDAMAGRQVGTAGGARARAFLLARLKQAGLAPIRGVFEHTFSAAGKTGTNVVGQIPGARVPDRYIVVSAHYDHVGTHNGVVFNGADDNASGAAALVAITSYFARHRPRHSLLVAAFDGEEAGLLGSRAFVARPPVDLGAIAINVNLDMIGRDARDRLFVVGTAYQPFLRPYVARVAARAPVRLLMGHDTRGGRTDDDWTDESDQFAFLEAGVPALYFGVEDEGQHHRPTDDYETMTLPFYVRAVETIIDVIRELDANLDEFAGRRVTIK